MHLFTTDHASNIACEAAQGDELVAQAVAKIRQASYVIYVEKWSGADQSRCRCENEDR